MPDAATKIATLQKTELFRRFDQRQLEEVAAITEEVHIDRGTVLCEQGRVAQECWIVIEGEANVEVGGSTLVGVVGPGESVGEMGLLDHLPRSATVTARTPMVALRVDGPRFETLLGASPLARGLLEILSRRIRDLEHGRLSLR
ncbi:MAG TPA: cyclic nucleotide-binding domain-containing protein [Acidimicrobiales bacterium]